MDLIGTAATSALSIAAKPLIETLVEHWLKPKVLDVLKSRSIDTALTEHAAVGCFREYLERSYSKNAFLSTMVFQNERKRLTDLYIPIDVIRSDTGDPQREAKERIAIDGYPEVFLPKHRRVIVIDAAGMGKSTLAKRLFWGVWNATRQFPCLCPCGSCPLKEIFWNSLSPS